ncbi:hypothetical protein AZ54_07610 [Xanthomonas oryzae pv. oryzae PXO86]|nr:hypothetical protein AZ54_07610 [Xanthomonas oryzae pv. oryzae PXO86]
MAERFNGRIADVLKTQSPASACTGANALAADAAITTTR